MSDSQTAYKSQQPTDDNICNKTQRTHCVHILSLMASTTDGGRHHTTTTSTKHHQSGYLVCGFARVTSARVDLQAWARANNASHPLHRGALCIVAAERVYGQQKRVTCDCKSFVVRANPSHTKTQFYFLLYQTHTMFCVLCCICFCLFCTMDICNESIENSIKYNRVGWWGSTRGQ